MNTIPTIPMHVLTDALAAITAAMPVLDKHNLPAWILANKAKAGLTVYLAAMKPVEVATKEPA